MADSKKKKFDLDKDPLKIMRRIVFDSLKTEPLRTISTIVLVSQVVVFVLFCMDVILTSDSDLFILCGPVAFRHTSVFACMVVYYLTIKKVKRIFQDIFADLWDFDFDPKLATLIRNDSKKTLTWTWALTILTLIHTIQQWPIFGGNDDLHYTLLFLKRFPRVFSLLHYPYYISIFLLTYCGLVSIYYWVYVLRYEIYQMYVLNTLLTNIDVGFSRFEGQNLLHDMTYQKKVASSLKIFIQRHQMLKSSLARIKSVLVFPFLLEMLPLTIFNIITIFQLLLKNTEANYYAIATICASALVGVSLMFDCGQTVQDGSSQLFHTAWNTRWMNWNSSNRKTVVIIMINSQKPCVFGIDNVFTFNYPDLVRIYRLIYSISTFLVQSLNRHSA